MELNTSAHLSIKDATLVTTAASLVIISSTAEAKTHLYDQVKWHAGGGGEPALFKKGKSERI